MVCLRTLALAVSTIIGLTSAAPSPLNPRQTSIPTNQNNTQEFYLRMWVTDGDTKYTGWALEAYHTIADHSDPVFTNGTGTPAYLNGTNLQMDNNSPVPIAVDAVDYDNDARWGRVSIAAGYGQTVWSNEGSDGLQVQDGDGWIVCEWFHGINAPQLFWMVGGSDPQPFDIPSSCARVILLPEYI